MGTALGFGFNLCLPEQTKHKTGLKCSGGSEPSPLLLGWADQEASLGHSKLGLRASTLLDAANLGRPPDVITMNVCQGKRNTLQGLECYPNEMHTVNGKSVARFQEEKALCQTVIYVFPLGSCLHFSPLSTSASCINVLLTSPLHFVPILLA